MSLIEHAKTELKAIGMLGSEDEMNTMMSDNILQLIETFAEQGHSGFSAQYCINMFTKLAEFKALSPLTGADDEWNDVSDYGDGTKRLQNKRYGSVFKDKDSVYNIDGKVFWEWWRDDDGEPMKTYYTSIGSRVPVTFPYTIPDEPIYEYRHEHEEGEEKQDYHGFY